MGAGLVAAGLPHRAQLCKAPTKVEQEHVLQVPRHHRPHVALRWSHAGWPRPQRPRRSSQQRYAILPCIVTHMVTVHWPGHIVTFLHSYFQITELCVCRIMMWSTAACAAVLACLLKGTLAQVQVEQEPPVRSSLLQRPLRLSTNSRQVAYLGPHCSCREVYKPGSSCLICNLVALSTRCRMPGPRSG
jgi:hypothetical protein